jgi:hypothetical protein
LKYIFKIKYLRIIFVVALVIALTIPAVVIFYFNPAFIAQQTKHTEDEALSVARHLMFMIIPDQDELANESLQSELQNIQNIIKVFKLMKLKIFSKSGETIYSTASEEIGTMHKGSDFHDIVASGHVYTKVDRMGTKSLEGKAVTKDVVEIYVPIIKNGNFIGAFEIYYDITAEKDRLDKILTTTAVALFILAFSLIGAVIIVLIALRYSKSDIES